MDNRPGFREYEQGGEELSKVELTHLMHELSRVEDYVLDDISSFAPCRVNRKLYGDEYVLEVDLRLEAYKDSDFASHDLVVSVGEMTVIGDDTGEYLQSSYCLSINYDNNDLSIWREYYLIDEAKDVCIQILDPDPPSTKELKSWTKAEKQLLNYDDSFKLSRPDYEKILHMISVVMTEENSNNDDY